MSVIKVQLSQKSVQSAINKLKKLQKKIDRATDNYHKQCVNEAEEQINIVAQEAVRSIPDGSPLTVSHNTTKQGNTTTSIVSLVGSQAVFVEFGTGVVFNGDIGSQPHDQYDTSYDNSRFAIGSWSLGPDGSGNLADKDYWRYHGKKQYGWQPYEPIYNGIKGIIAMHRKFAEDSFGSIK